MIETLLVRQLIGNSGPKENDLSFAKQVSRRELGKFAIGGALGATVAGRPPITSASSANPAPLPPRPSGIRLALDAPAHPKDEDIMFFKQLGVDCVDVRGAKAEDQTVEGLRAIKKRYADAGLMINDADNSVVNSNLADIVLNNPGRDAAIEAYKSWIRTMGEAGFTRIKPIQYNATSGVTSGEAATRGSHDRDVDLNSSELTFRNHGKGQANSPLFGREYSREEIWENYTHFIKQVAPVAEEAGVKIGLHPDDPPCPSLFGVPRILSSFEDCEKALKIANSPNVGLCFATGSWLAGGPAMGVDPTDAIRHFASQKQLFAVYIRNPSSPLPHYHDTYVDDGYFDIYKIMKALVDVKYDGEVAIDHDMKMVGGPRTYGAFGIGYMRALLQHARAGHAS